MTLRTPALAVAAAALAGAAQATPAVGLVGERTLAFFDTESPKVVRTVEVRDVAYLVGVDLRPATGQLIGVTPEGVLVDIDPRTGAATIVSRMDKLPAFTGAPVVVDFNPAADKLRFMTGVQNFRVDPATGATTVDKPLAFAAGDMHAGETPMIVAAGYSNSYGKPEKTALYDVDATILGLIRQSKPNDGVLEAIGKLGVPAAATWAFDVATDAAGANTAWLVADNALYTVNLETGAATSAGRISGVRGPVRDIAAMTAD